MPDPGEIHYIRYQLGPQLYRSTITEELRLEMLEKGLGSKIDWRNNLAGAIEDEKSYTIEDKNAIWNTLKYYVESYIDCKRKSYGYEVPELRPFKTVLKSLWINNSKPGEYNPLHTHSEDLSFVIYLDVSKEIAKEKYIHTSLPPGSIEFVDGLDISMFRNPNDLTDVRSYLVPVRNVSHKPSTGEIFIFPAYLHHQVQAFFTPDAKRISVSGNIKFLLDDDIKEKVKKESEPSIENDEVNWKLYKWQEVAN